MRRRLDDIVNIVAMLLLRNVLRSIEKELEVLQLPRFLIEHRAFDETTFIRRTFRIIFSVNQALRNK